MQGPDSTGTEWRVHYALDLIELNCDCVELTHVHGAELLEQVPMRKGDVVFADRYYLRPGGVAAGAYVLVRPRWCHPAMLGASGAEFKALRDAARLKVGQVGSWPVNLLVACGESVAGRVVATKLPAPVAAKTERRAAKKASKM